MRKDHNILEDIKEEEKMRRQMKRRAHSRIRRTYHRAAALITVIPFIALPASMIAYAGNYFLTYFGLIEGERGFLHFFLASSLTVMVWASLSNIFEIRSSRFIIQAVCSRSGDSIDPYMARNRKRRSERRATRTLEISCEGGLNNDGTKRSVSPTSQKML